MAARKKLIEVAIPLEIINEESIREKSLRHGHLSTLHLWWSRKPLATARAVLFASLVDDPSNDFPEKEAQQQRQRLFRLIEQLVKWENADDPKILLQAKVEIAKSIAKEKGVDLPEPLTDEAISRFLAKHAPPFFDPFAGGGSIPLEAQRLGLRAYAGDLNPVAVLINKALIEIPARFAGQAPVNPDEPQTIVSDWKGATGLAKDILYYGKWLKEQAWRQIKDYYPPIQVKQGTIKKAATVIAWLWVRTVKCPNPACQIQMPLTSSFWLSKKKKKEAWVKPKIIEENGQKRVQFDVQQGKGEVPEGTVNRRGARCICCEQPVSFDYLRQEGKAGRMEAQLLAIVAKGEKGRIYLSPDPLHEQIAKQAKPEWGPEYELPMNPRDFKTPNYGLNKYADLFTARQLLALNTFSQLLDQLRAKVVADSVNTGLKDDGIPLAEGGTGATAYAEAIVSILLLLLIAVRIMDLRFAVGLLDVTRCGHTFARQAIPMVWDFAEANFFSDSTGNWLGAVQWIAKVVSRLVITQEGQAVQLDAASGLIEQSHY